MSSYAPMSFHLTTEQLILQPWNEADADDLRALHAERGDGTPTIERTHEIIARQLTSTAETGIALQPSCIASRNQRRDARQFLTSYNPLCPRR